MSWFGRIFNPITNARDAQVDRGTRVFKETFKLHAGLLLEVGIPLDWFRTPWQDCIRFAPPEVKMVNRKYSAKIDVLIQETGRPLPEGGVLPKGRVDDIQFAYQHLYGSFQCLDFKRVMIEGADDAAYIRFKYDSYGVRCVDSHTFAQSDYHNLTIVCSAVEKYLEIYEEVYQAVHASVRITHMA